MGIIAKAVSTAAYNAEARVVAFRYNNWRVIINKKEISVKDIAKEADALEVMNYLKDLVEKGQSEIEK
jgi:hypothetical protein